MMIQGPIWLVEAWGIYQFYTGVCHTGDGLMDFRGVFLAGLLLLAVLAFPVQADTVSYTETYTTAGTYSWTVPAGVTFVNATIVGGGGGGKGGFDGTSDYGIGGNGGSPGQIRETVTISVTPSAEITIVVGAGGSRGAAWW
jgi:hypothetical protein